VSRAARGGRVALPVCSAALLLAAACASEPTPAGGAGTGGDANAPDAGGGRGGGGSGGGGAGGGAPGLPAGSVVIGYFPTWAGDLASIQFENLSHIKYSFVLPTAAGGLTALEQPARLNSLVAMAHARGVKVSIAIGGWNDGDDSAFEALAGNAAATAAFVEAVAAFVTRHNLDGADIDWEYPDTGTSATNFTNLIKALSARLKPMGKLLTAAVIGRGRQGEGVQAQTFEHFDFINIMAYDEGSPHSTYATAEGCLTYWLDRGLPAKKAILGLPFYGTQPYTAYKDLVARDPTAPTKDAVGTIHYNGVDTIKRKTALGSSRGGGLMIWELTQDTSDASSLLRAIRAALPN
jgi:chitinase